MLTLHTTPDYEANYFSRLSCLAGFALVLSGCAVNPGVPSAAPTITISTIPAGADISVGGNYIGQSPIAVPMPASRVDKGAYYAVEYRADAPMQIEAQLKGYDSKSVSFGTFHAPVDEVQRSAFYTSTTTTKPGYYTFNSGLTIMLSSQAK